MSVRVEKNIYYLLVPADPPNGGFVQQTLNNLPGNNRQVISWLLGGKVIQLWVGCLLATQFFPYLATQFSPELLGYLKYCDSKGRASLKRPYELVSYGLLH